MRPPHIAPAIAVTPARLFAVALLFVAVLLVALAVSRRRTRIAEELSDAPLSRLKGFHIFGPDEDGDDDLAPRVHVPVLRARPATVHSGLAAPPPPSAPAKPAAASRPAAAKSAPAASRATTTRPAPTAGNGNGTPRKPPAPAASTRWDSPHPAHVAVDTKPAPARPTPPPKRSRDLAGKPSAPVRRPTPAPRDELPWDGDILLVEDDVTIATMYQLLLNTRGYSTRHAHDGVEGIAKVREQRPALILLDMMMPRMDGIQFLEALRGWPRTEAIPVVVLSNRSDADLVDRAMDLGAIEYLVKAQTRPQVLVGALPHWLRGNRALTTLS